MCFAAHQWQVYELSRHGHSHDDIVHIDCDVTDITSCHAAIDKVLQHANHIDVVISNAGYGIAGAVEFTGEEDAHKQMEVNFFGAFHLTQAVLPTMREHKKGRILYTSSVAAVLPVPYQAFYSASKAAINAMALSLQNEVKPFGIQISVLMPGDVSTGFTDARTKGMQGAEIYTHAQSAVESMEKDEREGMKPEKMAALFYKMATVHSPRPFYVGGMIYKLFYYLSQILPSRFVNWIEGKMYS